MIFERQEAAMWHQDVPGARWLKADLHVHTLDDHPGNKAKQPAGLNLDPASPDREKLTQYAREVLRSAIRVGVQVLGLTPHSPRLSQGGEISAVWRIVEVWNEDDDDDGVPFREKVYAVFPGFEPNINDGGSGIHLLFLFDPEIGRDAYLRVFDAIMGGDRPWNENSLRMTARSADDVFDNITGLQTKEHDARSSWDYLVLAPHFQAAHGLLNEAKKQVLEHFPSERLAGYELGDNGLSTDFSEDSKPGSFLLPFMAEHAQAFYHASDAYQLPSDTTASEDEIGYRTTWFKLASPRIEALRQAFIAHGSRLRIAYERDDAGGLREVAAPDPFTAKRCWLRRVRVQGKSAFFHRTGDGDGHVSIDLSPDLTCIIGGSMTGKSTLLDGLRVHIEAELPSDERLKGDVLARGRDRFLAGQPQVDLDTPGDTTSSLRERWPAVFFTQNELQRLVREAGAVRSILSRFVPEERDGILRRDARISELDDSLGRQARWIGELLDELTEAEQLLSGASKAHEDLRTFESAGLKELRSSEQVASHVKHAADRATRLRQEADALVAGLREVYVEAETLAALRRASPELTEREADGPGELETLFPAAQESARQAAADISRWAEGLARAAATAEHLVARNRRLVERKLAELGYGAEKLAEFKTLGARASKLTSYQAARDEIGGRLGGVRASFEREREERRELVTEQREAFDRIGHVIESRFDGKFQVRPEECGISDALGTFLTALKQQGITSWWRGLDAGQRPCPERLVEALDQDRLEALGCSEIVARRLRENVGEARRYEIKALRSPDRYVLSLLVREGEYRDVAFLSGGRRVSLLLSLLLDAYDERPLVIDQPEDELDNRFLWETVLPALRRLKGRRQVVVATHNANIVVNGDADLVVVMEADADHGHVAVSGAIEMPEVRRAIVETVDGGEMAFELRKAKYGF